MLELLVNILVLVCHLAISVYSTSLRLFWLGRIIFGLSTFLKTNLFDIAYSKYGNFA